VLSKEYPDSKLVHVTHFADLITEYDTPFERETGGSKWIVGGDVRRRHGVLEDSKHVHRRTRESITNMRQLESPQPKSLRTTPDRVDL